MTTNAFYLYTTITSSGESSGETNGPQLASTFELVDKLDARIKSAQLLDAFIGVLTENGKMLVYEFDELAVTFNLISPSLKSSTSAISCFSLYKDEKHGLMTSELMAKTSVTAFAAAAQLQTNKNNIIASHILANKSNNLNDSSVDKLNGGGAAGGGAGGGGGGSLANEGSNTIENLMNVDDDEDELLYGASSSSTNLLDGNMNASQGGDQKNGYNSNYFTADKMDFLHEVREQDEFLRFVDNH